MTDENRGEQGESIPLNWACTNCGYRVEGELSEQCPGSAPPWTSTLHRTQLRCPRLP